MKFNSRSITVSSPAVSRANVAGVQTFYKYDEGATEKKAIALEILLNGGFNKYGRHIDLEKYESMQDAFDQIINDLMHELN